MLTLSSSISFKYKRGIISVADPTVLYGKIKMTKTSRFFTIENNFLVFTGSLADSENIKEFLTEEIENDPRKIDSKGIHKLLQRYIYNKRTELKPLKCDIVIGGITEEKESFLGTVNSKGVFWYDNRIATGLASHLTLPIMRNKKVEEMEKEEAIAFIENLVKVMVYKNTIFSSLVEIAILEEGKITIEKRRIETNWEQGFLENEIIL